MGVRYLSDENYEEAIIAFTAAIEIDPMKPDTYINLSKSYAALGYVDKAVEVLKQAIEAIGETDSLLTALEKYGITVGPRTERYDNGDGTYSISEYNENGKLTRYITYRTDGTIVSECQYLPNGHERVSWYYDTGTIESFCEYNAQNNRIEMTNYNTDGSVESYALFDHDSRGNEIRGTWYCGDGTVDFSVASEYDENNHVILETFYDAAENVTSMFGYEYGSDGMLLREISYHTNGTLDWATDYNGSLPYVTADTQVRTTYYNADGSIFRIEAH